jgi:hypothetical protein
MDETPISEENNKKPREKIFTIILITIVLIAAIFLLYFNIFSGQNVKQLTTTYSGISPSNAYDLINTTKNLTIIDMRNCRCNYEKNHLHGAIWDINPSSFYNTSNDLLVYDINGTQSIDFCKRLVNNVYGRIMYLEGGIDRWIEWGYPIVE